MITPAEIRQKALKLWESGRILQSALQDDPTQSGVMAGQPETSPLFPWTINFRKPNARQQLEDFSAIRSWMEKLKSQSREASGYGYEVIYKTINHRQLGEQRLPDYVVFTAREDLLRFIQKRREFEQQYATATESIARYPVLKQWIGSRPRQFSKYHTDWLALLTVCEYFLKYPRPGCYVRELDIAGIDSKFIEQHRGILSELLDCLLPAAAIDSSIQGNKQHGFERRYGLKYVEPVLRLRLLDTTLCPQPGMSDISLPLSQLRHWPVPCETVFITENKINGLSFPDVPAAVVIFGLGYGVDSLAEIDWLHGKRLFYWGDIDTHGLSILSRLRSYFPEVESLLMDAGTLEEYSTLCVDEPIGARCAGKLTNLSTAENQLYQQLQQSHQRLEQERISMQALHRALFKRGLKISDG